MDFSSPELVQEDDLWLGTSAVSWLKHIGTAMVLVLKPASAGDSGTWFNCLVRMLWHLKSISDGLVYR